MQTAVGTVAWHLDDRFTLSGGLGYAWLATTAGDPGESAPTFRVNLTRGGDQLTWHVGYRQSFIPSFGFGGRFSNQEFQAGLRRRRSRAGSSGARARRSCRPTPSAGSGRRCVRLGADLARVRREPLDTGRRLLRRSLPEHRIALGATSTARASAFKSPQRRARGSADGRTKRAPAGLSHRRQAAALVAGHSHRARRECGPSAPQGLAARSTVPPRRSSPHHPR